MDRIDDETSSMAGQLERLRARLPRGWTIVGPVAEHGGWSIHLHAEDPSVSTGVWRSRVGDALRVFEVVVDEVIGRQ